MAKGCQLKEASKGGAVPDNKGKDGKGKGKRKTSVNEVTAPTESTTTPPVGTSASQISRISQDNTWHRPVPVDEDEDESYETGYILTAVQHREPFRQSKEWYGVCVLVANCADDHVCFPRDVQCIAIEPSRNLHLVSASGHELKHYGEQSVRMKLRDGRKIWITFQACQVNGPIMGVGKL